MNITLLLEPMNPLDVIWMSGGSAYVFHKDAMRVNFIVQTVTR